MKNAGMQILAALAAALENRDNPLKSFARAVGAHAAIKMAEASSEGKFNPAKPIVVQLMPFTTDPSLVRLCNELNPMIRMGSKGPGTVFVLIAESEDSIEAVKAKALEISKERGAMVIPVAFLGHDKDFAICEKQEGIDQSLKTLFVKLDLANGHKTKKDDVPAPVKSIVEMLRSQGHEVKAINLTEDAEPKSKESVHSIEIDDADDLCENCVVLDASVEPRVHAYYAFCDHVEIGKALNYVYSQYPKRVRIRVSSGKKAIERAGTINRIHFSD